MQVLRRWQDDLTHFVGRNSGTVLLLGALFAAGVIFGALAVPGLSSRDKQDLVQYLVQAGHALLTPPEAFGSALFRMTLAGHLRWLVVVWILGITVVGALGVMLLAFIRGFFTGFVVGFLAAEMGWHGLLVAAGAHLPQSLIEVPAVILAGTAAVAFSRNVLRMWSERRHAFNFYRDLWQYTSLLLIAALALVGVSLVEATVSPLLWRLAMRVG